MVRGDRAGYWRATRRLMLAVVVLWLAFGIGATLVAADLATALFLGWPAAWMLAGLISPLAMVGLVFWFADRQDRLDRDYGMAEED